MTKKTPVTKAERQARWRRKVEASPPFQRALKKVGIHESPYTAADLEAIQMIQALTNQAAILAKGVNRAVVDRYLTAEPSAIRTVILEEADKMVRVNLPMH